MKKSFFPGDFESANSPEITKNNSQGIIFAIISCQRVKITCRSLINAGLANSCSRTIQCGDSQIFGPAALNILRRGIGVGGVPGVGVREETQ